MAKDPLIRVEGIKPLTKTLKDVSPTEARNIARRAVTSLARVLRDDMRGRAPLGPTGNLRKAIKSRRAEGSRDRAEAEVWVDRSGGKSGRGYHWHLVEFGTVKMPAQPFTLPTLMEWRPQLHKWYRQHWWPQYEAEMKKRAKKQRR